MSNYIKNFLHGLCEFILNYVILKIPFHCIRLFFLRILYQIDSNVTLLRNIKCYGFNISIGSDSIINNNVLLDGRGKFLIIGNNVDIAQESQLWSLTHDYNKRNHDLIFKKTVIEDYVWICTRAIILPGVRIGKGAIIGAGCVVRRDVEEYSIMIGNPATMIGKRNKNLNYNNSYKPFFK